MEYFDFVFLTFVSKFSDIFQHVIPELNASHKSLTMTDMQKWGTLFGNYTATKSKSQYSILASTLYTAYRRFMATDHLLCLTVNGFRMFVFTIFSYHNEMH